MSADDELRLAAIIDIDNVLAERAFLRGRVEFLERERDEWHLVSDTMEATRDRALADRDRIRVAYSLLLRAAEELRPYRPAIRGGLIQGHPQLLDALLGVISVLDHLEET